MKFILEIDKQQIIDKSVLILKKSVSFVYQWLTHEGELLGYILSILHIIFGVGALVGLLISYTIYPSFWLQFILLIFLGCVTLQHIFLRVCVVALAEKELTQTISPFYSILENTLTNFGIDYTRFIENVILSEALACIFITLHLISRISIYLHDMPY